MFAKHNRKGSMFDGLKRIERNTKDARMHSDTLATRKAFFMLTSLLSLLASSSSFNKAIEEFLKVDGDLDFVYKLLLYLKLPKDMLENLLSDNEMVSSEELTLLRDYIFEIVGTGSVYEFANHAIDNPPSVEFLERYDVDDANDYDMDWSFFTNIKKCKRQLAKKKSDEFDKSCEVGQRKGVSGFWLYPKDFENPKTHGISGTNHKSRKSVKTKPKKEQKDTADNKASKKKDAQIDDKRAKSHGAKPKESGSLNGKSKEDLFKAVGV